MNISIEDTDLITKIGKKTKKPYSQQRAYAHLVNSDGSPKRYPTEILVFANSDNAGNPVAHQKGEYELQDSSFDVDNFGNLKVKFVNLKKIK